jgi:hypothetical protein
VIFYWREQSRLRSLPTPLDSLALRKSSLSAVIGEWKGRAWQACIEGSVQRACRACIAASSLKHLQQDVG